MEELCKLFGKSRQAYYERSNYRVGQGVEEQEVLRIVREVREDFPLNGARKLLIYIRPQLSVLGIKIGRDAFIELLYRNFMLVRRIRNKRKTSCSNHWMHKYPNLMREYSPIAPNQLWVSDITYLETKTKVAYLSLITDAYFHKIAGWNLASTLRASNSIKALRMALDTLPGQKRCKLIHHSDRGSQYCCARYVKLLNNSCYAC
jgi:transposase InsO family protein